MKKIFVAAMIVAGLSTSALADNRQTAIMNSSDYFDSVMSSFTRAGLMVEAAKARPDTYADNIVASFERAGMLARASAPRYVKQEPEEHYVDLVVASFERAGLINTASKSSHMLMAKAECK